MSALSPLSPFSSGLARSLLTDLSALLALALLAALWLFVSRAWRRAFPEHAAEDEAKDVRWGNCGAGCGCAAGTCRREIEASEATGAVPFTPNSPHPETRR